MRLYTALLLLAACADNGPFKSQNPMRDTYEDWVEIAPADTVCSDGSQYKFWVNYTNKSDNLVVVFEPGGACWDYASCSGAAGVRGAANPNGLPDDHWTLAPFISPFLNRTVDESPSKDWNMVYVPYCTGDVHTGNVVAEYTDPGTGADLTFRHEGHDDVMSVVSWIDSNFTHVPKMLVTGCSAGGVGSMVNYHFLRNGVHAAEKGYLLDDSGPIFPDPSYSTPMHQKIRSSWNLDSLMPVEPGEFSFEDMGSLNIAVADEFPHDRIATTFFERDNDFSQYSYERFYNEPPKDQVMAMWAADTQLLVNEYATRPNLYYYLPYWRDLNDSHCTTVITFTGSDFADRSVTAAGWFNDLVDDKPLQSAIEPPVPGEDP
jgi:hypothetical protein